MESKLEEIRGQLQDKIEVSRKLKTENTEIIKQRNTCETKQNKIQDRLSQNQLLENQLKEKKSEMKSFQLAQKYLNSKLQFCEDERTNVKSRLKSFGSIISDCKLIVDGEIVNHTMFTDPGLNFNVTIAPSTPDCLLRILAVGGGGHGGTSGGGSGYINYTTRTIISRSSEYKIGIKVGNISQATIVTLDHIDEVRAEPGQTGDYDNGGRGYSGGGAWCLYTVDGCDGGYNGGHGEDRADGKGKGGHGTGEDVTEYKFDHYKLSPGDAGERYKSHGGYYYGGGGGGVLVNDEGPSRSFKPTYGAPSYNHMGQGYGGGGGFHSHRTGITIPGVVILEIETIH